MKLYYSPGACSLSPHIVLREAGLPFELERVDLRERRTAAGADYASINPKGYVPALQLDDGEVLTENAVIVQYLADRKPESNLAPPQGTFERYRLQEWLNFVATEMHKSFSPLFKQTTPEEMKRNQKELIGKRLDYLSTQLRGHPYLMGQAFTVADAYLFTILTWAKPMGVDLEKWPEVKEYFDRIAGRPSAIAAREAERPKK